MIKNLTILFSVVLLCVFAGEIVVRMLLKDRIILFPRYHTDAVYGDFTIRRLRPNTTFWHTSVDGSWKFVTNAQGYRDKDDFTYEKPEGVIRVVALGDSQTLGFEVRQERTFAAITEQFLREQNIRAEVLNMGISGFSTAEQLILLKYEGIKYKPDFVILGFYANDFEDNIKAGFYALENDTLAVRKNAHIPAVKILNVINEIWMIRWFSENSYLYSLSFNTVWDFAKSLLLSREQKKLQTEFAISTQAVDEYGFRLAEKLIQEMYVFCRQNGIRLIIVDIPRKTASEDIASSVPPEMLDTMRANSDEFLYSKDVLAEYRKPAEFHLPNGQGHISEFAHEILGKEMGRLILQEISKP